MDDPPTSTIIMHHIVTRPHHCNRIIIPSYYHLPAMRSHRSPSILILLSRIVGSRCFSIGSISSPTTTAAAWAPPTTLRNFGGGDATACRDMKVSMLPATTGSLRRTTNLRSTSTTTTSTANNDDENTTNNSNTSISSSQPRKNATIMPPLSSTSSSSSSSSYLTDEQFQLAHEAMQFIDNSPDPFHVVQSAKDALEMAGFVHWNDENEKLHPGGKYYFTRNKSTLVAFAIGQHYPLPSTSSSSSSSAATGGGGFKIIGSHTDSPNLKIKPYSKRTTSKDGGVSGMRQLSVECYGGGLWHTWFDRDLGVSGRVFVREEEEDDDGEDDDDESDGTDNVATKSRKIRQELVKIDRAILRIPNLAIHLQTASERDAFSFNKEDHLAPIIAMAVKNSLGGGGGGSDGTKKGSETNNNNSENNANNEWMKHQEPVLVQLLASHLGIHEQNIVDFELNLFDVQRASLGGAHSEFLHSARLDNLASCFLSLKGLIEHVQHGGLEKDADISMIAMFDHEEVGSSSATGAGSPIVGEAVKRISHALSLDSSSNNAYDPIHYDRAIRRSFVLSVDQAHAVHPNYASKHEKNHGPKMNGGMVIKRNSNQRYATNAVTGLIVREIARRAGLPPIQEFVVRNDCGCGSTIGPVISTNTGIRAIDMGCPQLSMHSIRETMGVKDLSHGLALFRAYFRDFRSVDDTIEE